MQLIALQTYTANLLLYTKGAVTCRSSKTPVTDWAHREPGEKTGIFKTSPSPALDIKISTPENGELTTYTLTTLKNYFQSQSFTTENEDETGIRWQNKSTACTAEPYDALGYSVTCGDKKDLDVTYSQLAPFALAYTQKMPSAQNVALVEMSRSTPFDQKNGYETANVNVGNLKGPGSAAGHFYRKVGDEWKFFKVLQSVPNCEEFNTVDLKLAHEGYACGADSTVRP